MIDQRQLHRRQGRIMALLKRTASANTAERCRLRLAAIGRQAREESAATRNTTLENKLLDHTAPHDIS